MPYTAYGMLTPFVEYNEKTIRKSPKTRNYSTQSILNSPVIIAEVSVAPSGESFRNTFFFLRMFQSFSVGTCRTRQITLWALGLITTEHDMRPIRLSCCYALTTPMISNMKCSRPLRWTRRGFFGVNRATCVYSHPAFHLEHSTPGW